MFAILSVAKFLSVKQFNCSLSTYKHLDDKKLGIVYENMEFRKKITKTEAKMYNSYQKNIIFQIFVMQSL